jgi:hypothetical protein
MYSELSLTDLPTPRSSSAPFHLSQSVEDSLFSGDSLDEDKTIDQNENSANDSDEQAKRQAAKEREEKLQRDLFILKKLNSSFGAFNDVLKDTQTGTEVGMLLISLFGNA